MCLASVDYSSAVVSAAGVVDAARLSVALQPSEQKQLSDLSVSVAASILQRNGVVLLKNALQPEVVDEAADAVAASFDRCQLALKDRGLRLRDPFAFAEIAHRSKLRFDMQLADAAPALPDALIRTPPWRPLLQKLLGDDCIDLFQGAVISEPGAADQQPHMDGGHLFQSTHAYEQAQNPCHCLNVFVPLVDVTEELGPTEFWPGSHVLTEAGNAYNGAMPSVSLAGSKGDAIIFDYRVVHRGRANLGELRRPVLYLTSSRSWFRDAQNFPPERLLGEPAAAKGAGGASAGGFGGGAGGGAKAKAGAGGKAKAKGGGKRRK